MKVPFWIIRPHAETILKSLSFQNRYGGDPLVDYCRSITGGSRKWMDETLVRDALQTLNKSIQKVSGHQYPEGTDSELLRSQALTPLTRARDDISSLFFERR
jgi:hypothetical protein